MLYPFEMFQQITRSVIFHYKLCDLWLQIQYRSEFDSILAIVVEGTLTIMRVRALIKTHSLVRIYVVQINEKQK